MDSRSPIKAFEDKLRGNDGLNQSFLRKISPSFRGRYAPRLGGLASAGTRNPWGSSIRCGLNPMDPRSPIKAFEDKLRGDDGGALKRLRKRHAGLARMALA